MNVYYTAAVWVGMALVASLVSIRIGISVALLEIVVGAIGGNLPGHDRFILQTDFTRQAGRPPAISPQGGTPPRAIMRGAL